MNMVDLFYPKESSQFSVNLSLSVIIAIFYEEAIKFTRAPVVLLVIFEPALKLVVFFFC
jgi:hypothetical protein